MHKVILERPLLQIQNSSKYTQGDICDRCDEKKGTQTEVHKINRQQKVALGLSYSVLCCYTLE